MLTSIVGAAFASRSLTLERFAAAQQSLHLEALFLDVYFPIFVTLMAVGILSKLGSFPLGYVARIARIPLGRRPWPGRCREQTDLTG